jgi:integrase
MVEMLLGPEGRRRLELHTKTNGELFKLYDAELLFRHSSANALREARRVLGHFHRYLGEYPPSAELAKSFLGQFTDRKTTTLARYVAVVKGFLAWYGEEFNLRVKVPKMLPDYVQVADVEKLMQAMRGKKSHKRKARRDILLVKTALNTGLRRSELANLRVGDIDLRERKLVVRLGKGAKDRAVPLTTSLVRELEDFIQGRGRDESLFGLAPATISGKIRRWAVKAGVKLHTHSLRDRFASTLNERGVSIREIQELLGHSNLANTERYTLLTPRHLRKAIDSLEPAEPETGEIPKRVSSEAPLVERPLMSWELLELGRRSEELARRKSY